MKSYPFAEAILAQTKGGLQIILDYYPEAAQSAEKKNYKFKRRKDEKRASTSLKEVDNGTWLVCDWGEWSKAKNAIQVCQYEDNLPFGEACKKLAKLYNIEFEGTQHTAKPEIKKRARKEKEKPGKYLFKYKPSLTDTELKIIGPLVTNEVAKRFNLKAVEYFSYIKENEVIETYATEEYPIFVFDFGEWQKIYQPKSADKSFRFRYAGGRPKDFLFGLTDAKKAHAALRDQELKKDIDDKTRKADIKLKQVIICSGERDALNMASLGYYVVWKNSESAVLTKEQYKILKGMTDNLCNLPDIDQTGVREAVKLGLKFLDIKTIWLPSYLIKSKDWRGNPRKDVKDFVDLKYNKDNPQLLRAAIRKMVNNAIPMQFWDEVVKTSSDGKYIGTDYKYNIVYAEHFLKHHGFYRIETENSKEEFCFVQIDGNIVKKTTANKIEYFVNSFLGERDMPIALRNMVKKTPYLNEKMLAKLPLIDIDFKDNDAQNQYWFFNNGVLQINAKDITLHKEGMLPKMVWEEKIIDFPEEMSFNSFGEAFQQKQFEIVKDKDGDDDIKILNTDNKFFNFLINISRMHWRKELEECFKNKPEKERLVYFEKHHYDIAGPNLDPDEILEQKQHLINKIYAIGYLLHKYKKSSHAWFVFGMDNKLSDLGESHGGSGKSLLFEQLERILKNQFYIPGRSKKTIESEFLLDGVTKDVDYIYFDDMDPRFPFESFFSEISNKMRVNGKNQTAYTLRYDDSPKMCGTSNFPLSKLDPSTFRRVLITVNSDYYHQNRNNEYKETRSVESDFGMQFFTDFSEKDYLDFYVLMAQCLQFYLSLPGSKDKKNPPMDNVKKRNLISEMGDVFRSWAEIYFSAENNMLDQLISRKIAYINYKENGGGKKSANSFRTSVKAFCEFNGYVLNPNEDHIARTKDGRIIKKYGSEVHECFYIKTKLDPVDPKQFEDPNHPDYEGDSPY